MFIPEALVDDPFYPRLKKHVVEATGLTYYVDKDVDLARRVARRLLTRGVDNCSSYLDLLGDPVQGPAELDALIVEITIGETYFFRHEEHFAALRDIVLPNIIARNRERRSLRIWCAGCADGPEPYSLAILLKRSMAEDLHGWSVSILGTDINRHFLTRAREGKFEEWALRSTSEEQRRSCFSKEGKLWSIGQDYREWVSFHYHNLVEDHSASLVNNLSSFDLIVCRNVMIYFGSDLMRTMIQKFHECLAECGWLLVGPTEPNLTHFTSFRTVNAVGVTLYQKSDQPVPTAGAAPFLMPSLRLEPADPRVTLPPAAMVKPSDITLSDVRRHADRGGWEEADRCCEDLLEKNSLDWRVHFYRGLVLKQMSKHAEAEGSLRRAIYLNRKAVLAHYYLGLLLQSRGDLRQAARSFENVLDLLRTRRNTETFADADGITVSELKKLAEMQAEILRESA